MTAAALAGGWDYHLFNHKTTFNGETRTITIAPEITELSVKRDVYSSWKEWLSLRDNAKYLDAIRVTGGDPIGGGEFTGDIYFLINDWRLEIGQSCTVDGVLYSDDFPSPFVQVSGTQLVTNRVSALVQTVAPVIENLTVNVDGLAVPTPAENAAAVWSHTPTRSLTNYGPYTGPSTSDIVTAIDSTSTTASNVSSIKTTVEAIDPAPTTSAIVSAIDTTSTLATTVNTINTNTTQLLVDVSSITGDTNQLQIDLANVGALVQALLKLETGRTKVDTAAKTLTVYDEDCTTPLIVFDLFNAAGAPSVTDIAERRPQSCP